jgi:hypothetical protein
VSKTFFRALTLLLLLTNTALAVNPLFIARGTQTDAWYSSCGKTMYPVMWDHLSDPQPGVLVANATTGVFGGSVIDNKTNGNYIEWPGFCNTPSTSGGFSVIARFVPRTSTPLAAAVPIMTMGRSSLGYYFTIFINSSGTVFMRVQNDEGVSNVNATTVSTVALVAGTPTELAFSWDGTATANQVKLSQDGVSLYTGTAASAMNTTRPVTFSEIVWGADIHGLGGGTGSASSPYLNELIVFDGPQSVTYTARTGYWSTTAKDATNCTDPGVSSVLSTAGTYYVSGVAKTPTLTSPTATDLRSGVTSCGTTGTLDLPVTANVLSGITFDNATKTGTYSCPSLTCPSVSCLTLPQALGLGL